MMATLVGMVLIWAAIGLTGSSFEAKGIFGVSMLFFLAYCVGTVTLQLVGV